MLSGKPRDFEAGCDIKCTLNNENSTLELLVSVSRTPVLHSRSLVCKWLQEFGGVNVTGLTTNQTKDLMMKLFCSET